MEPLLAYVLYKDGEKAVVPVSLIKDYCPKSTKDLAKNKLVYWRDKDAPDGGDEDYYPGDIEELAGELQEHLKKRKTCQCSEQQQVCNSDIPATREPELGSESLGARDVPGEGLAELAAAAPTAVEAAASSSPSPAQQGLPVQAQIYVPTSSVIAQERQRAPRGGDTQNGGRENEEVHLACGVTLPRGKWAYLQTQPKDSLFVREMAKALWGMKELYNRSITGRPCHRFLHKEGVPELPERRALTPEKLKALRAAFEMHMEKHPSIKMREERLRSINISLGDMLKVLKN
ncbi:uncharacterized protein LOC144134040 [Amblyomma americanum]